MNTDRRRRERVALECFVKVSASAGRVACDAVTVNISSDGIYWISQFPFTPGERIHCSVYINANGFRSEAGPLTLDCRVSVVRVEEVATGFGVGCRIEYYVVSRDQAELTRSRSEEVQYVPGMTLSSESRLG